MLQPGQTVSVLVEKPAAGGRMIARVNGQVVLVAGAIPGERVLAQVDRVGKGVAYAKTLAVEEPSADRVAVASDPQCGGCSYAHIDYERQREIKSLIIADAFARIAGVPLPAPVTVARSPIEGYRMRARLHRRGRHLGFFREGTHELCDARQTRQLLPATCDVIDALGDELVRLGMDEVTEVELAENARRLGARGTPPHPSHERPGRARTGVGVGGCDGTDGVHALRRVSRPLGQPACDRPRRLRVGPAPAIQAATGAVAVRRHVLAFFQGNRFLVHDLVAHVVEQVPIGSRVVDLYAGGGLFAVAAARARQARVTAVEGDKVAADDLMANAAPPMASLSMRCTSRWKCLCGPRPRTRTW